MSAFILHLAQTRAYNPVTIGYWALIGLSSRDSIETLSGDRPMRAGLSALASISVMVGLSTAPTFSYSQSRVDRHATTSSETRTKQAPGSLARSLLGSLPLHFEKNDGQAPRGVQFLARGPGYTLLLERDGVRVHLPHTQGVSMRLVDPQTAAIVGREPSPTRTNYYIGSDPAGWHLSEPDVDAIGIGQNH